MFPGSTYLLVREYSDFLLIKAYHKKCENTNVHKELMEILTSEVAESLVDYATTNEIDLISIATHGCSGVSRWAWGSMADRVLHSTCVTVLMIRAPGCWHLG